MSFIIELDFETLSVATVTVEDLISQLSMSKFLEVGKLILWSKEILLITDIKSLERSDGYRKSDTEILQK